MSVVDPSLNRTQALRYLKHLIKQQITSKDDISLAEFQGLLEVHISHGKIWIHKYYLSRKVLFIIIFILYTCSLGSQLLIL